MTGIMVAAEPGVEYAPLYYKPLDKVKDFNLRKHKGDFDRLMKISRDVGIVIKWWLTNLSSSFKPIMCKAPELSLYTDASMEGWGAFNKTSGIKTGGRWSVKEQGAHIIS